MLRHPSELAPARSSTRRRSPCRREISRQARFEQVVEDGKEFIPLRRHHPIRAFAALHPAFRQIATSDSTARLRTVNPSPYMFILEDRRFLDRRCVSEVHVRLTTAGRNPTDRRHARDGQTPAEDVALEQELLADEKERAEHLMLVDLARNDYRRVVPVRQRQGARDDGVERYSHVMHIVSQVEGQIAAGKNAYDLMRATFPPER
jgi:anthranilate synthase component 1